MVISRVPMLPNGKALDRNRTVMHMEPVRLRKRLADVAR